MTPRGRARAGDATARVVYALAAVAAGLTLYQVTRPGLLFGVTPDVAVYLGGAVRLVHGAVPYRDYVFVQPPAFVLFATPIGLLSELIGTRDALGVLRLLTPLLAAANVLLVGRLIRHRGVVACLVACTVMACLPAELYAIRGPQLEPIVNLFCLAGAVLIFEGDSFANGRRMVAGGAALGAAMAVKLSAVIPVALLLLVGVTVARRNSRGVAAGVVGGFAVLTLPFTALAPGSLWRDTVTTQLSRVPSAGRASVLSRLAQMTGLAEIGAVPAAIVLGVSGALVVFVVGTFAASRRRPTPLEWFAVSATIGVAAAQFAPAQYYPQYAALLAPFVSLLLGLSAARALEVARARRAAFAAVAVACAALLAAQAVYVSHESAPDVARAVDAVVPAGACTLSNAPVYLVTADRFQSTIPGCAVMTDPAGTLLALSPSTSEAVVTWRHAFEAADYVVTDRAIADWNLPAGAMISEYVARNFHMVDAGTLLVYVRSGFSAAG
jgi:alpha-1,2-mannosyltransferase